MEFLVYFSYLNFSFIPLIFLTTIIGSFLPDLDSDQGTPLTVLLSLISLLSGMYVVYFINTGTSDISFVESLGYGIVYIIFMYYVIGGIFKKFTVHRGMFHSIPAILLSILISLTFFLTTI